jgi:exoribonuclease-2
VWSEDQNVLLLRHQVPDAFGRDTHAHEVAVVEAARDTSSLQAQTKAGRADFTQLDTCTIDDPDTLDIDDALSIEQIPGGWRVGIHIADVAEYVKDSDPLDSEAFRRGQTLYLPDRKIPMVPETLSNGIASLVAGELRPAVSVMVDLDDSAYVRTFKLTTSLLKVRRRLSYEQVDALFETDTGLSAMLSLARRLKQQRLDAGALVFNVPDIKVRVDDSGSVAVKRTPNDTDSHVLVSEMMILANRLVAEWFIEHKVPALYRVQSAPDEPMTLVGYDPVTFYRLRRLIKRTEVSITPRPHAGLGIKAYVQMTSPIRRYADLTAHRQIRGVLAGTGPEYSEEDVRSIMNAGERAAEVATLVQRDAQRYWMLKYLKGLTGQTVPALVLDRRDESYVVQLVDYLIETPVAARSEHRYEVGESLLAKIVDVDPRRNQIRCMDAGRPTNS